MLHSFFQKLKLRSSDGASWLLRERVHHRIVMLVPMSSDIHPTRHPRIVKLLDIVQEPRQCRSSAWPTDQTAMQANRHHLRRGLSLLPQVIKRIFQVRVELITRVKPLRRGEAHIVHIQCVRNHQVRSAELRVPVR